LGNPGKVREGDVPNHEAEVALVFDDDALRERNSAPGFDHSEEQEVGFDRSQRSICFAFQPHFHVGSGTRVGREFELPFLGPGMGWVERKADRTALLGFEGCSSAAIGNHMEEFRISRTKYAPSERPTSSGDRRFPGVRQNKLM
jgi:hypothetical protein